MPSHLPKLFRLNLETAIKAVGDGETVAEVLNTLLDEGTIRSVETILEIRVDKDKAAAVENYFYRNSLDNTHSIKRKKGNRDDY